ncbi:conserved exported protein of unknown function [Nitrosopumilus adriaticus]|uniref:Uncharacterized protein n=2 Tax=Nitrosopumilus adriaticus TaxID=1580092 RepID=A0A0D5C1J5_9ARCH|nr:conserved exported protein of unknown function [Nitrosopumilus adriaticus]
MVKQDIFSMKRSKNIGGFVIAVSVLFVLSLCVGSAPASAHTSVNVENIKIDVGWGIEPPVVGIRNDFVFKIVEVGETEGTYKGITSAFKNIDATAMYGGATKKIDINSDPRPGYYYSPVIPTKTGSIIMDIKGEINGINIDVQIPIEDVESTAILDFPQQNAQTSSSEVLALKNAIASLQKKVSSMSSESTSVSHDEGSYDLLIFSLSLGAAGVILAIISMVKKLKHVDLVN